MRKFLFTYVIQGTANFGNSVRKMEAKTEDEISQQEATIAKEFMERYKTTQIPNVIVLNVIELEG